MTTEEQVAAVRAQVEKEREGLKPEAWWQAQQAGAVQEKRGRLVRFAGPGGAAAGGSGSGNAGGRRTSGQVGGSGGGGKRRVVVMGSGNGRGSSRRD